MVELVVELEDVWVVDAVTVWVVDAVTVVVMKMGTEVVRVMVMAGGMEIEVPVVVAVTV